MPGKVSAKQVCVTGVRRAKPSTTGDRIHKCAVKDTEVSFCDFMIKMASGLAGTVSQGHGETRAR